MSTTPPPPDEPPANGGARSIPPYTPCPRCTIFLLWEDAGRGGWTCQAGHHFPSAADILRAQQERNARPPE